MQADGEEKENVFKTHFCQLLLSQFSPMGTKH